MKHLGDITKINGAGAPVVNVIIGETKKRTPHYFCEKDYSKEVNSDDFCHIIDKALSTIAEMKENADV